MFTTRSLTFKRALLYRPLSSFLTKPFSACSIIPRGNDSFLHQKTSIPNLFRENLRYQVRFYIPSSATFEIEETNGLDGGASSSQSGFVKWFDTTRGYGFIVCDALDRDIFVHQTDIVRQGFRFLDEGDEVKFYVEKDQNGKMKAKEVTDRDGKEFMEGHPSRSY